MATTLYITAGLPAIDSADSPPSGDNKFFITAGLPATDYISTTDLSISVYDTVTTSEQVTTRIDENISVVDTTAVSEDISLVVASDSVGINVSDFITAADVPTVDNSTVPLDASDTISVSEEINLSIGFSISVVDVTTVTESVSGYRTAPWYNADSITINYGTLNGSSGTREATWQQATDYFIVNEINDTPPFQVDFAFHDIPVAETVSLRIYGYYNGNPAHIVKLYAYNYNTTNWDAVTTDTRDFISAASDQSYNFTIHSADYIQSGNLTVRIQHNSSYAAGHYLYINWMYLVGTNEVNVNDTVTISESSSAAISDPDVSIIDTCLVSESVSCEVEEPSVIPDADIEVYDEISVSDVPEIFVEVQGDVSVQDTVSIDDSVSATVSDPDISTYDELTLSEQVVLDVDTLISVVDSITVAEDVLVSLSELAISINEAVSISEDSSCSVPECFTDVYEEVSISELAAITVEEGEASSISTYETVGVSEAVVASVSNLSVTVTENITCAELVSVFWNLVDGLIFLDVDIIIPEVNIYAMLPTADLEMQS